MKKLIAILLIFAVTLPLCSCGVFTPFPIRNTDTATIDTEPAPETDAPPAEGFTALPRVGDRVIDFKSDMLASYEYTYDEDSFAAALEELSDLMDSGASADEVEETDGFVYGLLLALCTDSMVAEMNYYAEPTDDNYEFYKYLSERYDEEYADYYDLLGEHAEDEYTATLWGEDMTKEDILAFLDEAYTDEQFDMLDEIAEYQNDSEIMNAEFWADDYMTVDEYTDKVIDDYYDFIKLTNRFANSLGYGDYLDYVYENEYYRDYTPEDSLDFAESVKAELAQYYISDFYLTDDCSDADCDYFNDMAYSYIGFTGTDALDIFENFAAGMGEDYEEAYNALLAEDFLYFAGGDDSMGGAYTNGTTSGEGVVYLQSDYQAADSFVHEFGHYYFRHLWACDSSFDLEETHSHGNEALFYAYTADYAENSNFRAALENYVNYELNEMLFTAISSSMVAEIEYYAYKGDWSDKDELKRGIVEIADGYSVYGDTFDTYWQYPVIAKAGYYISYATSAVAALKLFSVAEYDMDAARDMYDVLINYDDDGWESAIVVWEAAGIGNVLVDRSVISDVTPVLREHLNNY